MYARLTGMVVIIVGGAVLLGWAEGIAPLRSILPGWATMKVGTALCFMLSGAAVALLSRHDLAWTKTLARVLALAVVFIGMVDVLHYFFPFSFEPGQLIIPDRLTEPQELAGRMSLVTACCFVAFGSALFFETFTQRHLRVTSQALACFGFFSALLALAGYVYGVSALYKIAPFSSMAAHTAAGFVMLGLGFFALHPRSGFLGLMTSRDSGGKMARTMFPAAIFVPFLLGWCTIEGHRAGWYDSEFGMAAFAVSTIIIFTVAVFWSTLSLHRSDQARRLVEHRLLEADHRKDEFLAVLAHELRNPLAPMPGALQILRSASDSPRKAEAQQIIESQLAHMVRLIDDLLDVSRISRNKIALKRETLLLAPIITQAKSMSEPTLRQGRHPLTVSLPPEEIWLDGDAVRLTQMLVNMLNNAAKYSDDGRPIRLSVSTTKTTVEIAIHDEGIGLDQEQFQIIFDMFRQMDQSLERRHGGLGIGLHLVKQLVEAHGGRIDVSSPGRGKGSVFTLSLPRAEAPSEIVAALAVDSRELDSKSIEKLRILIVDDNIESAKTLGWMVEMFGYEYRLSHTARTGMAEAIAWAPDVLMLDIGMPDMNGYDLCMALRKEQTLAKSIFIAQTGWGQDEHRQRSREAGFTHHFVKPVDMTALEKVLAERSAA